MEICKFNEDWPKDRGIFLSKSKKFWIKVNFRDHLEISYTIGNHGFMEALDKLVDALSKLEGKPVVTKKEGYLQVIGIYGSQALKAD